MPERKEMNEKDQKVLKEIEAKKKKYVECFSTASGQEVLEDLKKMCYYKYTTFSKDPQELAYREGIRSVLLQILFMMDTSKKPNGGSDGTV